MVTRLVVFLLVALPICAQQKGPSGPTEPLLRNSVEAMYTEEARAVGLQGTVSLYVEVDEQGATSHIQVLSGLGLGLDEQAIEAVKQWRYEPGTLDGQPVKVGRSAMVKFSLEGSSPWRIRLGAYSTIRPTSGRYVTVTDPSPILYEAPDLAACPAEGGRTIVRLQIGANGTPTEVKSRNSDGALSAAAAKAIKSWRFHPGKIDGRDSRADGWVEFECGPLQPVPQGYTAVRAVTTRPQLIEKVEPWYSDEGRMQKVTGPVRLAAVIDTSGHVTDTWVFQSLGYGLDEKAMQAVQRWRFQPGALKTGPVNVLVTIEVSFHLL